MRIFAAIFIALALSACAREQPERVADGCALRAAREINFSSASVNDTVSATSDGPNCDQAVVTLVVRNRAGDVLLARAGAYVDLAHGGPTPPGTPAATLDEVQSFLDAWVDVTLMQTSALPPWRDGDARPNENEPGLIYESAVERAAYETLRANDQPMLCYAAAAETSQCLIVELATGRPVPVMAFGS